MSEYNLEALRDQVSMVLQKNVLFTGTIYDNIRWGNEHASEERSSEGLQTCTGRWLHKRISGRLSYDDRAGRKQCFRRTEAASVYCTGTSEKTEDSDSG